MGKHSTSITMLAVAAIFYVVFGLIIPGTMYPPLESASGGIEHASASVGQVMRKVVAFISIILAGYAGMRFIKELNAK